MSHSNLSFRAIADKPTIGQSTVDRAMGRLINIKLPEEPTEATRDLAVDAFHSLNKQEPALLDDERVPGSRKVNRALMSWMMEQDAYDQARSYTLNNPAAASASTLAFWAAMQSDEAIQEALKKQDEADQAESEAEEKINQAIGNSDSEALARAIADAESAEAAGAAAATAIDQMRQDPIRSNAANAIMSEAARAGKEVDDLCKSWGIGPGDMTSTDIDLILSLAGNNNFTALSDLLGRLTGIASTTIQNVKTASFGAVSRVDRTKKIPQVFPAKFTRLSRQAPVVMRARALQEFIRDGLLGWVPIDQAKKGGSFLMYVDESGSMRGAVTAAKALAMGIARALQDDDPARDYGLFGFSDDLFLPGVWRADDWRAHITWARQCANGGTKFVPVFNHAIDELERMKERGVTSADFVFVTDGIAPLPAETINHWKELKTRISTRLIYLRIGGWGHDKVAEIADLKYLDIQPAMIVNDAERLCAEIAQEIARHAYNGN